MATRGVPPLIVSDDIFGQSDALAGIAGDGQEDIVGVHQIAGIHGGWNNRDFFFLEITFQCLGAAGGVV